MEAVKSISHRSSKRNSLERRNTLRAYAFLLPNFIGFLIFTLIPVVCAMLLSFVEWDSANPMVFVGLKNYARILKDETFMISFWNTLYYTIGTVPLTMVCSLVIALVLNNKLKGIKFFRAAFFFPYIVSMVAVAVVWNMIFHPTMGPVNSFLMALGIENPPGWTASVEWAMPAIIFASVWRQMGYFMVMYLAGLQGIPRELYEAAVVDGANSWQKFKNITLPMLTPTSFFVSVMCVINGFKIFDMVAVMTEGGPGRATNVLVLHIYNQAFLQMKFGYAAAVSMVLLVLVLSITVIQFKGEQKWVNYM
ncbi:MAG: sugar ABC transporter permease [Clostridia bacterium]|nr:sugar ABC transporter permease [Clostridia bacterium]